MPHADVDRIAGVLADMAAKARALPPSFRGCGDRIPVRGPEGQWLGYALPGEGLYVDLDLKSVGITRPIPGVRERSRVQRGLDRMGDALRREGRWWERLYADQRGAITTYDAIIAARAGGKADDVAFTKTTFTTTANAWYTTFRAAGLPIAGTFTNNPGATLNNTNVGALSLGLTNPSGGDSKYLLSVGFGASVQHSMVLLVDLLVGVGNLNANSSSAQTFTSPALTRNTTGAGVLVSADVTGAFGATPANLSFSYTNQAGTSGQTSVATALTTSAIAQQLQPAIQVPVFPLASGDYGVRAIASVTLSAAMGSGTFALNLFKILAWVPGVAANVFVAPDAPTQIDGLVQLTTEAGGALGCLALYVFPSGTTAGSIAGYIRTCAG